MTWAFQLKLLVRRKNRDRYAMKKIKDIEFKIYSFFRNQDTNTPWIAILFKKIGRIVQLPYKPYLKCS
jgi:hypothetical protein